MKTPTRLPSHPSRPGYYQLEDGKLKFVSLAPGTELPTRSNDDILKTFVVFLVLLLGVIFGGIVFVMSLVVEPPAISELVKYEKRVSR